MIKSKKQIVVMGFMGTCPIAGVVWQHLHYIIGLQRLGHTVYYLEDSARNFYNPKTFDVSQDGSYCAEFLAELAERFDFVGRWGFSARYLEGRPCTGQSRARMQELYRESDLVLNICGSQDLHEDLEACSNLVYVESDPGVEQIKVDQGDEVTINYLKRHRQLFTFGEAVPGADFPVPLHGFRWFPTRQPVVVDLWEGSSLPPEGAVWSSIANWSTSGKKDVTWRGETYFWSKTPAFLEYSEVPVLAGEPVELATDIGEQAVREQFLQNGWRLSLPHELSADFELYRSYIQGSRGEFTVAKDQYVRLKTGWFSDRSACYLAAGRPVVTQETGFTQFYGGREGLLSYTTPEEAAEAIRQVRLDYPRHAKAARELAWEFFSAEKVLADLLDRVS
jgi:hypothetical protein